MSWFVRGTKKKLRGKVINIRCVLSPSCCHLKIELRAKNMVAPQFLVKMVMDIVDKMVPNFLGTGDITHEDEFRFHQ